MTDEHRPQDTTALIAAAAPGVGEPRSWEKGLRLAALVERAQTRNPLRTAIVHPVDPLSLRGAMVAAEARLISPLLIGPRGKIEAAAEACGINLRGHDIVDVPHSHAAADCAAALAHEGRAAAVMKGALHTDELLHALFCPESGLRTDRRASHVFVVDAPAYHKLLLVTDAAVNIRPDLQQKADIVQNAIDLARAIGVERPKAAILSAVETVNPRMTATLDAAALCKMAEREQIRGGVLDGPLAFDNAISAEAARAKGLVSAVAGDADILVAPDIEVGNILAKQMDYLGGAIAAGLLTGLHVPVMLTSRADGDAARMASCALAHFYAAPPGPPA